MENIKIPADTYNYFMDKYKRIHEQILDDIEYCNTEIKELLQKEEGFHADMISEKLNLMMALWDDVRVPYLKNGFEQLEKSVQEYLTAMQNEDGL